MISIAHFLPITPMLALMGQTWNLTSGRRPPFVMTICSTNCVLCNAVNYTIAPFDIYIAILCIAAPMSQSSVAVAKQDCVQLFIYKIPTENHDVMLRLAQKFNEILRKHGTLASDFYQLKPMDVFKGLSSITSTVSASPDEEVWIEVDHYKNLEHREAVLASIRKDPESGPTFGPLSDVVSQGYAAPTGVFSRLQV